MSNKYLYIFMATIMAILYYHVGGLEALNMGQEGGFSSDWWFASILAVGLGAGQTGGDNAISIFIEGVRGYIPTMIALALLSTVGTLIYNFGVLGQAFSVDWILITVANFVFAALFINLTLSYLKKAF